jgi:general secretion pathway protein G
MKDTQVSRRTGREAGFTLIEILLVTVIIGILAGSVVMVFAGGAKDARIKRALQDIRTLENVAERYVMEHNDQMPNSLDDIRQYIKEPPKDPWGHAYVYLKPGRYHKDYYDIFSKGPDGVAGTEDDVAPWLVDEHKK